MQSCEWVEIRQFLQTKSLLVVGSKWQESDKKEITLRCNKNYAVLAFNYILNI